MQPQNPVIFTPTREVLWVKPLTAGAGPIVGSPECETGTFVQQELHPENLSFSSFLPEIWCFPMRGWHGLAPGRIENHVSMVLGNWLEQAGWTRQPQRSLPNATIL